MEAQPKPLLGVVFRLAHGGVEKKMKKIAVIINLLPFLYFPRRLLNASYLYSPLNGKESRCN